MSVFTTLYALPWAGGLAILLLRGRRRPFCCGIAFAAFAATAALTPVAFLLFRAQSPSSSIGRVVLLIIAVIDLALAIHLLITNRHHRSWEPRFYALLLLLTGGINAVALARTDWIMITGWVVILITELALVGYDVFFGNLTGDGQQNQGGRQYKH